MADDTQVYIPFFFFFIVILFFGFSKFSFQTIVFTRKVVTTDKVTDFPLDKCYHFLFPVGGGRVLARKSQDFHNSKTPIGYHDKIHPESSAMKICICDESGAPIGSTDTAPPPRVRARRASPIDPVAKPQVGCADTAVVDLLGGDSGLLRVADGFVLSSGMLSYDEVYGGTNSLTEVATVRGGATDSGTITVLFKKSIKGLSLYLCVKCMKFCVF